MRCWLVACVCVWAGGASAETLHCRFYRIETVIQMDRAAVRIDGKPAHREAMDRIKGLPLLAEDGTRYFLDHGYRVGRTLVYTATSEAPNDVGVPVEGLCVNGPSAPDAAGLPSKP